MWNLRPFSELEEPGYVLTDSYFVSSNLAISSVTWKTKTGRLKRSLLEAENCGSKSQLLIKRMGPSARCPQYTLALWWDWLESSCWSSLDHPDCCHLTIIRLGVARQPLPQAEHTQKDSVCLRQRLQLHAWLGLLPMLTYWLWGEGGQISWDIVPLCPNRFTLWDSDSVSRLSVVPYYCWHFSSVWSLHCILIMAFFDE